MKELAIEGTIDTPSITLRPGEVYIIGRSIPEHVNKFFDPVMDWLKEYIKAPEDTHVRVSLEYANSCTLKYLNDIFKIIEKISDSGKKIRVDWEYDDDDDSMFEMGQDIESIVAIKFDYHPISRERFRHTKVRVKNSSSGKVSIISSRYWDAIQRNGHGGEYEVIEEINYNDED